MRFFGIVLFIAISTSFCAEPFAVVKAIKGHPYYRKIKKKRMQDITKSLILFKGIRLETKEKEKVSLRLFSGNGDLEIRPRAAVEFRYKKIEGKVKPVISLVHGDVILNLSKRAAKVYALQTKNTEVLPKESRWLGRYTPQGVTKLIVLKGKIVVNNLPKGTSLTVKEGQTAISDETGVRIVDSDENDLNEFKINFIELDFVHSLTEETKTLQLEYETDF